MERGGKKCTGLRRFLVCLEPMTRRLGLTIFVGAIRCHLITRTSEVLSTSSHEKTDAHLPVAPRAAPTYRRQPPASPDISRPCPPSTGLP